jgi:hypothetical protein
MTIQELKIQRLRRIVRPVLTLGAACLASRLLTAPGWSSRHGGEDCPTGNARAIGTQARQRSAQLSQFGDVIIGLLNRKIERIDARLARSHDAKEKARLLQMRQQLQDRIAHVGPTVQRMLGSGTSAKGKSTPTPAGPPNSTQRGTER